jgi:tetratricopeptide (TPR) repeat protein
MLSKGISHGHISTRALLFLAVVGCALGVTEAWLRTNAERLLKTRQQELAETKKHLGMLLTKATPEHLDELRQREERLEALLLQTRLRYYDRLLDIEPFDVNVRAARESLFLAGGYEEAIQYYDWTLEYDPEEARSWYFKGLALEALQLYPEAQHCYERAFSLHHVDASDALKRIREGGP